MKYPARKMYPTRKRGKVMKNNGQVTFRSPVSAQDKLMQKTAQEMKYSKYGMKY